MVRFLGGDPEGDGHRARIDCFFGDARNAEGRWQCAVCGWVYRGPNPHPPRHPCRHPDAVRIRLGWELDALFAEGIPALDRCQVEAILRVCFGGCPHFSGATCTRWGSPCRHRRRWIEALCFTGCDLAAPAEP